MNTGLGDIFNEISVGKLQKNDSSPQTTNLARINTGIAEMLFGRTETPKGIGTVNHISSITKNMFGRTETPKGIGTNIFSHNILAFYRLEEQKPQRGLEQ